MEKIMAENTTEVKPLTRLERAQWMASKGITAFIVDPNSKRPLGGNSWYVRNTTDPQQLADWFDETPDCNYGLWLGEEYVVIDLDVKHDTEGVSGIAAFDDICEANGVKSWLLEFNTLMVETPSGGYHLYFKTPRPCANKNTFPNLIDVRGAVGYVVGPHSKIDAGTWEVMDEDAPIMDIPEFLLAYLVSPADKDANADVPLIELDLKPNIDQATAYLKDAPPAIAGENGDDRTYDICCQLRDYGLSETEALHVLNESGWNGRCDPAWDEWELATKVKNAYAFAQNRPGCKAATYERTKLMVGRPTVEQLDRYTSRMKTPAGLAAGGSAPTLAVDNTARKPKEEPEKVSRFMVRDEAMQDSEDDIKWLVEGMIPERSLTVIYGPENSLKSFLVLDLCLCASAGIAWASFGAMEGAGGFPIIDTTFEEVDGENTLAELEAIEREDAR